MTSKGYVNDLFRQFEKVNEKLDKANDTISRLSFTISIQIDEIKELTRQLEKSNKEKEELVLEIERLKNNNKKNSSNSSKPSGANGYKNVVTNNREKSNKKKGAQPDHKGTTLTSKKIEELISNGEIDEIIEVEENKNEFNKNLKPVIKYEYDIQIKRIVTKHIIYPNTKTNINYYPVTYGNNIKVIQCILNQKYMSLDGIQSFIYDTTNNNLLTSKGSFYSWNKEIYKALSITEYAHIQEQLMNTLIVHVDESPIKINGKQYYLHNISDGHHTLQYVTEHRSKDSVDEFGFLKKYKGIIVHDHYIMYYNYGADNAECNVHVLRYLNAVSEFTNHKWSNDLKKLLLEMKDLKEKYLEEQREVLEEEYNDFKLKYLNILYDAKEEMKKDLKTNPYKKEEISLINRLIKYCHNHLLFLRKTFVPFSNNRAESDLRGIKIKQKTGKFRSVEGANIYAVTKSCISTYIKNGVNIFDALNSLLNGNPKLV